MNIKAKGRMAMGLCICLSIFVLWWALTYPTVVWISHEYCCTYCFKKEITWTTKWSEGKPPYLGQCPDSTTNKHVWRKGSRGFYNLFKKELGLSCTGLGRHRGSYQEVKGHLYKLTLKKRMQILCRYNFLLDTNGAWNEEARFFLQNSALTIKAK